VSDETNIYPSQREKKKNQRRARKLEEEALRKRMVRESYERYFKDRAADMVVVYPEPRTGNGKTSNRKGRQEAD